MKVRTKLSASFGILVLLLVGMLIYQVGIMRRAVSTGYELSGIFDRLEVTSTKQLNALDRIEEMANKYAITRDVRYSESGHAAYLAFDSALARLDTGQLGERERAELRSVRALWARFPAASLEFRSAVASGSSARATRALAALNDDIMQLRVASRGLADASREGIRGRLEISTAAARSAERSALVIALAALVFSIIVGVWIVHSIANPLRMMQKATQHVAGGNFEYRLTGLQDDEFAQLSSAFNQMTEQLGELERMKRDFLSKFSHDLKTPLASMQETSRAMADGVAGAVTPKQKRLLDLNLQSGQRLAGMIAKILDLSAMEAGAVGVDLRWHDLVELVQRSVDLGASAVRGDRVHFETEFDDPSILVECDAERMLRVLDNLCENAVKFSPQGGTIRVSVRLLEALPASAPAEARQLLRATVPGRGYALVSVDDEGPGVPADERAEIFGRFYQAAGGRSVENRGVGLGLAICQEIIDAHGGMIWVEESAAGGSSFRFVLADAQSAALSPAATPSASA